MPLSTITHELGFASDQECRQFLTEHCAVFAEDLVLCKESLDGLNSVE